MIFSIWIFEYDLRKDRMIKSGSIDEPDEKEKESAANTYVFFWVTLLVGGVISAIF